MNDQSSSLHFPASRASLPNPDAAADWTTKGYSLVRQGYWSEAEHAFQEALTLSPQLAPARFGQAQVYLHRKQYLDAIALLQGLMDQPRDAVLLLPVSHLLVNALIEMDRFAQARTVLAQASTLAADRLPGWLVEQSWRVDPAWWETVHGRGLRLRRPGSQDAEWFKAIFSDGRFASTVNRSYADRIQAMTVAQIEHQFTKQLSKPPADLGALTLVIERASGEKIGIASFVTINQSSRSAEFIIGFPGRMPHGVVVMEAGSLLANLAFKRLGFHKIMASLYADNPRLTALTSILQRVGFEVEGVRQDGVRLADGRSIHLHLWSGLGRAVLTSPLINKRMARMKITP